MNLSFTEIAEQALLRIKKFIAKSNPQAAERMKDALLSSLQHLTEQPEMGTVLKKGVRQWIPCDYITRYKQVNDTIYILRLWHHKECRK